MSRQVTIGRTVVSVRSLGTHSPDGRPEYEWRVGSHRGRELRGPVGARVDEHKELGGLLGFLAAAGESYAYPGASGENAGLFPPGVSRWAAAHQDDLAIAEMELEEGRGRRRESAAARSRSGILREPDRAKRRRGVR